VRERERKREGSRVREGGKEGERRREDKGTGGWMHGPASQEAITSVPEQVLEDQED
jgi:hypothetical protein